MIRLFLLAQYLLWIVFNRKVLSVQRDWLASLLEASVLSRTFFLLSRCFLHIQCKVAESIFVQSCLNLFWNSRDCLASTVYKCDILWISHQFHNIFSHSRSDIFKHFWFFFSLVSFLIIFYEIKVLARRFEARISLIQIALRRRSARCIKLSFQAVFNLLLSQQLSFLAKAVAKDDSWINKHSSCERCACWIYEWKVLTLVIYFTICVFLVCRSDTRTQICLFDILCFRICLCFLSAFCFTITM